MSKLKPTVKASASPPAVAQRPSAAVEAEIVSAFNACREELVGTLFYLLGNREDALDAAQDTFMKCWRSHEGLAEVKNLKAWIFRIALNTPPTCSAAPGAGKPGPSARERSCTPSRPTRPA